MLKNIIRKCKDNGGDVETIMVICPYCNQTLMVEATKDVENNEDLKRELAIESCKCDRAEKETSRKEKLERMDRDLCNLIGEKSENPVGEDVYLAIREVVKMVSFGEIRKASISLEKNEKVVISRDKDGITNINREKKNVESKAI